MKLKLYLVRLTKNREIVGIFATPSRDLLWDYVDECCDPGACECTRIDSGGGIYRGLAGAPAVPHIFDEDYSNTEPDWFAGSTISELWNDAFFSEGDWEPVVRQSDEDRIGAKNKVLTAENDR